MNELHNAILYALSETTRGMTMQVLMDVVSFDESVQVFERHMKNLEFKGAVVFKAGVWQATPATIETYITKTSAPTKRTGRKPNPMRVPIIKVNEIDEKISFLETLAGHFDSVANDVRAIRDDYINIRELNRAGK